MRIRVVGRGRAGGALAGALTQLGHSVSVVAGRDDGVRHAASGVEIVVVAVPDAAIEATAAAIEPDPGVLVVHVAGALGLEVLGTHVRRGALHPLVSMPDATTGAQRLMDGAWFAIDADDEADRVLLGSLVAGLGGRAVTVADADRVAYHAAAAVASNHLVALFAQVSSIAAPTGVPLAAFVALAAQTLAGLAVPGADPAALLTGPVARGDWDTVARHLAAIDPVDRPAYAALAEVAARVAGRTGSVPPWLAAVRRGDDDAMLRVEEDR